MSNGNQRQWNWKNCKYCGGLYHKSIDKAMFYFTFFGMEGWRRREYCCENHYEIHTGKDWPTMRNRAIKNPIRLTVLATFTILFVGILILGQNSNESRKKSTEQHVHVTGNDQDIQQVNHTSHQSIEKQDIQENASKANQSAQNNLDTSKSDFSINDIVKRYFELQNSKNFEAIGSMYDDKLERFYLMRDIGRDSVIAESKKYAEKNPQSSFEIETIEIDPFNKNEASAIGISCQSEGKCSKVKISIKINDAGQIRYIRALKI